MWKGRATSVLQKAVQSRRYHNFHQEQQHQQFWPVLGAALSLLVLAELDQQWRQQQTQVQQQLDETSSKQCQVPNDSSLDTREENDATIPGQGSEQNANSSKTGGNHHNHTHHPLYPTNFIYGVVPPTTAMASCEGATATASSSSSSPRTQVRKSADLRRFQTLRKMEEGSTKESLESRYNVDWNKPLGEGSFGAVYVAKDQQTGELVAVKKISKRYTNEDEFYREMNALLHLRKAGGHPGICGLREHFNEGGHYYLILDLVSGGEMFDHLVEQGAYSEADAARLIREVASSLLFIHGLDTTHGDLKPENLMLSSKNPSDAVIKLVDFGCAQVNEKKSGNKETAASESNIAGKTLAYCPPEALIKGSKGRYVMHPSMDMWSLGIILYIMLTGLHPYDIRGQASDEEVAKAIMSGAPVPLRNSPITAHLSESAIDLIERLMDRNPKTRIDAWSLLQHPWVKGETALTSKMALAGKKLSMYHAYKSGIERKVFEKLVTSSDDLDDNSKRTSLIEQSFRWFDEERKGHIDLMDLQSLSKGVAIPEGAHEKDAAPLSLSGFSDLLSEHMQNRYFPKGHVVYREGEIGNQMYFISSGTITVSTKTGFNVTRGPGDFFGEGALLSPNKRRSATIHCNTPVHAMEISREYFDKYLARSDSALYLFLREKDIIRKKNRAKVVLRLQKTLKERQFQFGEVLFEKGDTKSDSIYIMEKGNAEIFVGNKRVFTAYPGNVTGENSALNRRPRSATAICATEDGCIAYEMAGKDFRKLVSKAPDIESSLRNLCLRRDFKKAVVLRLNKEFPYSNPREAFDAVKTDMSNPNYLTKGEITKLIQDFSPYTEKEIDELIRTIDLTNSGTVSFDEFKKVFIADIKASASK